MIGSLTTNPSLIQLPSQIGADVPLAFSHFSTEQLNVLSRVEIASIDTTYGCNENCFGCAEDAPLADPKKNMTWPRLQSIAIGVNRVRDFLGLELISTRVPVAFFGKGDPLRYRFVDATTGVVKNAYDISRFFFETIGVKTFVSTTAWMDGDNFVHGAASAYIKDLKGPEEESCIACLNYSVKLFALSSRRGIDEFAAHVINWILAASDEDLKGRYGADAELAFGLRERMLKYNAENGHSPDLDTFMRFASSLKAGNVKLCDWVFSPFNDMFFSEHKYFSRLSSNIAELKGVPNVLFVIHSADSPEGYPIKNLKYEYFFGFGMAKEISKRFFKVNDVLRWKYVPFGGAGRSLSDFNIGPDKIFIRGLEAYANGDVFKSWPSNRDEIPYYEFREIHDKFPSIYGEVRTDGRLAFYFARRTGSFNRIELTAEYLLSLVPKLEARGGRFAEQRARECAVLASLAGVNVFPDLYVPNDL